jgi:hypothetical protein
MSIGGHQSPKMDSDVWLTPPDILSALGDFDLDPAACVEPRPWPTAKQHYTIHDNGLKKPWHGRVWLNPPYGGPSVVGPWMRRMAHHNHGTALIFARTETAVFFDTVWRKASALLFIEGRLFFHYPDGRRAKNNSGGPSVLIAYGDSDAALLKRSGLNGHFLRIEQPIASARAA